MTRSTITKAGGRARGLTAVLAGAALVAASLGLAAPAAADEPSAIESWGADGERTIEDDGSWVRVFDTGVPGRTGGWLVLKAGGELAATEAVPASVATFPSAVENGSVVDAHLDSQNAAWGVTADGSVHKWGNQGGIVIPNQSWSPETLGGRAVAVTGETRGGVAVLEDGSAVALTAIGVSPLTLDGDPLSGVSSQVRGGGALLLEDGAVVHWVAPSATATMTIEANADDPVVEISSTTAVTQSGGLFRILPGLAEEITVPGEIEGTVIQASRGSHSQGEYLVLTDAGELATFTTSGGQVQESFQVPEHVSEAPIRQILYGAPQQFVVWTGEEPEEPFAVDRRSAVDGTPEVGEELQGTEATFTGDPESTRTEWRYASGEVIPGSTDGDTYTLTEDDEGEEIVFVTIASKEGFEDIESPSEALGPVINPDDDGNGDGGDNGNGDGGDNGNGDGGDNGDDGSPTRPGDDDEDARCVVATPGTLAAGTSHDVAVDLSDCGDFAGQDVRVWLFSDPINLGTATVGADGTFTVTIPASAPAGAHQLAVYDLDGELIGYADITLTDGAGGPGGSGSGLPATGYDGSWQALAAGVLLVLLGGIAFVAGRMRKEFTL